VTKKAAKKKKAGKASKTNAAAGTPVAVAAPALPSMPAPAQRGGVVTREEVTSTSRLPAKRRAISEWMGQFNTAESTVAAFADQVQNITELRRPSGIISLDIDCGGGLPANRMSIISGPDNAGKSFLLAKYMAMHQRLYGPNSSLAILNVEPFNYKRALRVGMVIAIPDNVIAQWNQERAQIGLPAYNADEVAYFKRQIGEVVMLRGDTGEEAMNIALQAVKSRHFGIVAIDSLSAMLPEKNMEKDVGETPAMAAQALLLTDFAQKYMPTMNILNERANETTLIGIAQVRSNKDKATAGPAAKYMKDWAATGAWATKHLKSIDIQIWDAAKIRKTIGGVQHTVGKELKWAIEKGKDGTHDGRTGSTEFYYEGYLPAGTDDLGGLYVEGFRQRVFVPTGKGTSFDIIHPVTRVKQETIQNPTQFQKMMAADFAYELRMRYYILRAAGIECLYQP